MLALVKNELDQSQSRICLQSWLRQTDATVQRRTRTRTNWTQTVFESIAVLNTQHVKTRSIKQQQGFYHLLKTPCCQVSRESDLHKKYSES